MNSLDVLGSRQKAQLAMEVSVNSRLALQSRTSKGGSDSFSEAMRVASTVITDVNDSTEGGKEVRYYCGYEHRRILIDSLFCNREREMNNRSAGSRERVERGLQYRT